MPSAPSGVPGGIALALPSTRSVHLNFGNDYFIQRAPGPFDKTNKHIDSSSILYMVQFNDILYDISVREVGRSLF